MRLRDTELGPRKGDKDIDRERLGQRHTGTQRPRDREGRPEAATKTTAAMTPAWKEIPSLDNFLVILPAALRGREAGKAEYPYVTDWETEVQQGEVTCPRSHSKSGLLTPSLVHFPHRDRGQRPRETETRGRDMADRGHGEEEKKNRDSDRESMTTATAHLETSTHIISLQPSAIEP